ncbi:helix-turn-helix domain-containing protein [Anaerocolumna sp. AGMB13025]|uniref:winged helix-turn-helix transcriptional regulator n=1 Tax=Anaerocolumna sp. AGMB13025 TaxID=3039116 RepID=UPI00241E1053|nr:helix-turn-helix domain-containing protein [Anaerocolumna sp. AGMB13025]WFR55411.1 helix-turn-helix domain-containing protein [Anaerocolumna sp. AGMB13025]
MAKSISSDTACPMSLGINVLSGRWKIQILWNIYHKKTLRFNELQRTLGNITTKTLTEQLRELEEQRIIKRTIFPEVPPKVEYSFTEIGQTLEPVFKTLCEWGSQYLHKISMEENQ